MGARFLSEDGQWWWDGQQWQPTEESWESSQAPELRPSGYRSLDQRRLDKERRERYIAGRQRHVEALNEKLSVRIDQLETILLRALDVQDWSLDFERLKEPMTLPPFDPQGADKPASSPTLDQFLPPPLGLFQRAFPRLAKRHSKAVDDARALYQSSLAEHTKREVDRLSWLDDAQKRHEEANDRLRQQISGQNLRVDQLRADYMGHKREAIIEAYTQVFKTDVLPSGFPQAIRVTYDPAEKLLVLERQLPSLDIVPRLGTYRYVKLRDSVEEVVRPSSQVKSLYMSLVAQVALRTLYVAFAADMIGAVELIVLNCFVDAVNPATGQRDKPCLLTVRVSKQDFLQLDLRYVQPAICVKRLRAIMSKSPHELEAVEPILRFNMVDARFVDGQPVLDELDQRPNLATLTAYEFESLVRDLFQKMGHDTRQTRASRDGGVDCVAWDTRPILGGKVVIQAKRYRHVVGVGAVRDLYGTMQNERANKGILITTSHYTSAAREFAQSLPLQLIDGAGLLSLLETQAGVMAKIEFPEGWADQVAAVPE